jgi:RNA polymerase sigma-70 factor (ECF subfamily)
VQRNPQAIVITVIFSDHGRQSGGAIKPATMCLMSSLADLFLLRVADQARESFTDPEALEEVLGDMAKEASSAWTDVEIPAEMFVAYVADRFPDDGGAAELSKTHGTDLYLACACTMNDDKALRAFETHLFPGLDPALSQLERSGVMPEEVKQRLREKLFVAPADDLPKIAEFTGRGSLKGWLRVAAMRTALNMRRKGKREVVLHDEHLPAAVEDIELGHLKRTYSAEFKEAFAEALRDLSPRERSLLRMHTIDGLNIDQLGALHKVHRTTAARWLREARESLARSTKSILRKKLRIDPKELESIMRLIRSRIDLSVRRHLSDFNE